MSTIGKIKSLLYFQQGSYLKTKCFLNRIDAWRKYYYYNHGRVRYFSSVPKRRAKDKAHIPVMCQEVLQYLNVPPGGTILDMTFGAGGHSTKILKAIPDVRIFALDRDPLAHEYATNLSYQYPGQVIPLLGRFSELPELLKEHNICKDSIDAMFFDFGCSSMQFDIAERGFSISKVGPLDMRMDGFRFPKSPTAADVLERVGEMDLIRILRTYGQEDRAKKIARAIIETRYSFRRLQTTQELAQLIQATLNNELRLDKLGNFSHCATKTFQALRIFVNNELNEIYYGIVIAAKYLKLNGRLITISFHSLEDSIVKSHLKGQFMIPDLNQQAMKYVSRGKSYDQIDLNKIIHTPWKMLHKHVLTPTTEEVDSNPRARSAKFRALQKVQ